MAARELQTNLQRFCSLRDEAADPEGVCAIAECGKGADEKVGYLVVVSANSTRNTDDNLSLRVLERKI